MKYECVSIQTKATEQYFPVELFTFIIPYEVLLTFESVVEILYMKATVLYFLVLLFNFYYAVHGGSNF